jgi:hypothetical protein
MFVAFCNSKSITGDPHETLAETFRQRYMVNALGHAQGPQCQESSAGATE